jgi:hypothetical protein
MACGFLAKQLRKSKQESDRLSQNQTALLADIQFYKTKAGNNAAKIQRLELNRSEFERLCVDLKEQVKELGVKNRYLRGVIVAGTKTEVDVKAAVRDSVTYIDGNRSDTLRCVDFSDGYVSLSGCIRGDSVFNAHIENVDTLSLVGHRVPKRFLFFRWGTKAVELDIVSKNPHTHLTYGRYVELKK